MNSTLSNSVVRELPVIRVFVSSTFSDLVAERNALAENVWPKLEHYCRQRGFTFQAIDLRWGVPSEAGLDHRTMQICMEELRRAQETSPEPNFLILLGSKYGWRPLPEVISEAEYSHLCKHSHSQSEQDVLSDWYRRDTNAKPTQYVLRARTDSPDGQDYTRTADADGRLHDTRAWQTVQDLLWAIVNRAYPCSQLSGRFDQGVNDVPTVVRFQASATEQEIWHGALQVKNARDHVVAAFREIDRTQGDPATSELHRFVDLRSDQSADDDAVIALTQLKAAVKQKLLPESLVPAECRWEVGPGGAFTGEVTTDHLVPMCDAILARLQTMILRQINDYWGVDLSATDATVASVRGSQKELELEQRDHSRFAQERGPVDLFVGRDEQVRTIREYLQSTTNRPLIVHGPSGSGKTALLAYVAQQPFVSDTHPAVSPIILTRFIGVHPESSTIRGLFTSLCRELRVHFPLTTTETDPEGRETQIPAPLPDTVHKLSEEFYSQLQRATEAQPIFVFLDALDQLASTDQGRAVHWLRSEIFRQVDDSPTHARLVVSCLSPSSEFPLESEACKPFRRLQSRGLLADNELSALDEPVAQQLIRRWLANQQRDLTEEQWNLVDAAIHRSSECRQPLYLKVLHELIRAWREFDPPSVLPTSLAELIQQSLSRLSEPSRHGSLPRIALGYVVTASYGLSEGELLEVLYRDPEIRAQLDADRKSFGHDLPSSNPRFPIAPWARLRSDLQVYLSERSAPGTTALYFYHRQVEQAARTMFLTAETTRDDRLRRLADYFDGRWDQPDAHALMELPNLLLALPDYEQLYDRLTDFAFPMRKAEVGLLESIPNDYTRLAKEGPLELRSQLEIWQDFFREKAHLLRRGIEDQTTHKILLQLALEHADDTPQTQAAEAWLAEDRCDWLRLQRVNRPPHASRTPCEYVLEGHTCGVGGAILLPNGGILSWPGDSTVHSIFGSELNDYTFRIWDDTTGGCRAALEGHTDLVNGALPLLNDRLLSWAADNTLRIWDCSTGVCQTVIRGHTVQGALSLPDERVLLWYLDKYPRILDTVGGKFCVFLDSRANEIDDAISLPDGQILSWSGRDMTLRIWDAESGKCRTVMKGHTAWVLGAILLPDGRVLSWSTDKTLRIWDATSGGCQTVMYGHTGSVSGAVSLPDGRVLSWSTDKTLRVWDTTCGECCAVLNGHTGGVSGVQFLSEHRFLSWAGGFWKGHSWVYDKTLRIWDVTTWNCLAVLDGQANAISGVLTLPIGRILTWGRHEKSLWEFDASTGDCRAVLNGHTDCVEGTLAMRDGRILSWSRDKTLRIWKTSIACDRVVLQGHADSVTGALSLTPSCTLTWSEDKSPQLWDVATGMCSAILRGHTDGVCGALKLSDSQILSWSRDTTLRVWDTGSKDCHTILVGHRGWVVGAHILPARRILSWSTDDTLRIWDLVTGDCCAVLKGHKGTVRHALLLPTERILSWASYDKHLRIWNSATGADGVILVGHTDDVDGALSLPDGKILSWASKTMIVWDGTTGIVQAILKGHKEQIVGALSLPNSRILSWSRNRTVRVWDTVSGACLEVVAEVRVSDQRPDWRRAIAVNEKPNRVANNLVGDAVERTAMLRHLFRTLPSASWQADSNSKCHSLLPDGTLVVGQDNGQVCFLKLYHGRQRISLAEAEELLRTKDEAIKSRKELFEQ
ncbi:MAG: AAA family ATPase [Planctomycetaceae bacterium]|nr:AAA family ATPase [Planctomycetales bacterium]MCB9924233.1 AAA family ATPase [Planctomycetaceae bacterium]